MAYGLIQLGRIEITLHGDHRFLLGLFHANRHDTKITGVEWMGAMHPDTFRDGPWHSDTEESQSWPSFVSK